MTTTKEKLQTIAAYASELLAALPPDPEPEPEPDHIRVTSALELARALETGRRIVVAPGVYAENFQVFKPTTLVEEQPATVFIHPKDPYREPLNVQSSDVSIYGFTIGNGKEDRETVLVGSHVEPNAESQPDNVLFEGTKLMAGERGGRRGFSLHGRGITLRNCEARNYWFSGQDSQAVWINNGPGPYLIEGGYYEASGENIMFGGWTAPTGVNPTGTVRGATLRKPLEWKGKRYTIKNLFEVKAGVGITLENCELDGCWGGEGQSGTPIVLTPRNQNGDAPWTQVDQVSILRNQVRNCPDGYAVNILGTDDLAPSQSSHEILIERNLFRDSRSGILVQNAVKLILTVTRNTFPNVAFRFLALAGPELRALIYEANVTKAGEWGIWGDDDKVIGLPSLLSGVQVEGLSFIGNVIEHHPERTLKYPAGNTLLAPGGLAPLLDADLRMRDGSAGY